MQTSLSELDFTKAIIHELSIHNIFKFNINDLECALYHYDFNSSKFYPLFQNIGCTCNHLDLSEAIWDLTAKGILGFNYPDVEIKNNIKLNINSEYLPLIQELTEDYLKRKYLEESSPINLNIIQTCPNKNEYPVIEGEYEGKEIRWNLITDGNINYKSIPRYLNLDEITDNYITVEKASYVIHNCYVNGRLTHIDIYTELTEEDKLETIKNIALNSDISIRLLRKKESK